MKRITRLFMALAIAMMLMVLRAPVWAYTAGAGIAGTPHDFTGGGTLTPTGITVGLCTYCHTPHSGLSTLLLWNQQLSTNTFQWDVPNTTSGTPFATFVGNSYSGPSAKCLSCHDGSVAVGDYNLFEGSKSNGTTDAVGKLTGIYQTTYNTTGSMQGNHPVAMPYPYGLTANTYNNVTNFSAGQPINTSEWVSTPLSPVVLYNETGGSISRGPATGVSGMECSSCHDPHNRSAVDQDFLLGMLTGNTQGVGSTYLCLKCHTK